MNITKEQLNEIAAKRGYRIEIVEKVILLSQLLEQIFKLPMLKDKLVLKGGTALNLFYFPEIPRLSVDIDLNYIGAVDKDIMLKERTLVEDALVRICNQNNYVIKRHPKRHAGGKMTLQYDSLLNHKGNLEVDLNYMYRNPIFGVKPRNSHAWPYQAKEIPVLDIHELAAGKLHALFTRNVARDLFDIHQLLSAYDFDRQKLKLGFIVYVAMSKAHWQDFTLDKINFDVTDIRNKLVPVISRDIITARSEKALRAWVTDLLSEIRGKLDDLLFPFTAVEQEFLKEAHENGKVYPKLICADDEIATRILSQPNLIWRIKNMQK